MKRIGRILFCLLPLFITVALQNLVSIPIFGITAIVSAIKSYQNSLSFSTLYNDLIALWTSGPFMIWISIIYAVTALFIFGFWYHKKLADTQEEVPVSSSLNIWIILSMLLLSIGLQYVVTYLTSFVGSIRPDWMQAYEDLMNMADIGSLSPLTITYACIIAPISEELIFRGVTLGYAKKVLPAAGAICLQAVLFGVFHMNMIQGIYAAFLGLFLGYICEEGGTIIIPILFHAFFNMFGTFAGSLMFYHIEMPFFFMLWLTVGVLLTYAGIFLYKYGIEIRDAKFLA